MWISDVKTKETSDPEAETNLAVETGIKKQPGATIDHTKVKITVKFYDTVGDKEIKLTDVDVTYEWLTPKHDWTDTNPEVISARYLRLKNKSPSPDAKVGHRRYLGYIIQVYHDDELQDVQAQPSLLLQHSWVGAGIKRADQWGKGSPEASPNLAEAKPTPEPTEDTDEDFEKMNRLR